MSKTVIGLFDERGDAENALQEILQEGYSRERVSLVASNAANEYADVARTDREGERTNEAAKGAGIGAGTGAVVGGVGGLLLGLGLLAIPGLGPLVAAGPIASTLVGAGVGAAAGGLLGALVGMGVPREEAEVYAEGVRRGGSLLTLVTEDDRADRAADIMRRNGAVDVQERSAHWRQAGWRGYDPNAAPYTAEEVARERAQYAHPRTAAAAAAHQAVLDRPTEQPSRAPEVRSANTLAGSGDDIQYRAYEEYDPEFRKDFETTLSNQGFVYERHLPAYRYGYMLATDPKYRGRDWDDIERDAYTYWEERNPNTWDQFSRSIRYAWDTVRRTR